MESRSSRSWPRTLAHRAVTQSVIATDPDAGVNESSWRKAAPAASEVRRTVVELLSGTPGAESLLGRAAVSAGAFRATAERLSLRLPDCGELSTRLLGQVRQAEALGHGRMWLGERYPSRAPEVSAADLSPRRPAGPAPGGGTDAELAVIVPVGAGLRAEGRRRNFVAALLAAHRQTLERGRYRIVVVEQGPEPRCAKLLRPLADDYVFAPNRGPFNKSWALNIGAVRTPGQPYLCLLDGDSLLEPHHLELFLSRLRTGDSAFLPFREVVFLDRPSGDTAVATLMPARAEAGGLDWSELRGFSLLEVKGFCLCVSRSRFLACGGYDERYRGWGDEDNEFHRRLVETGPVTRLPGRLVHLWHERPQMTGQDRRRPNAHLIGTPRPAPPVRIGDIDKYRPEPDVSAEGEELHAQHGQ